MNKDNVYKGTVLYAAGYITAELEAIARSNMVDTASFVTEVSEVLFNQTHAVPQSPIEIEESPLDPEDVPQRKKKKNRISAKGRAAIAAAQRARWAKLKASRKKKIQLIKKAIA